MEVNFKNDFTSWCDLNSVQESALKQTQTFSVFLEGGYVSKQSVVVCRRGVLQNNLVLWQAACKMPNLDESNRIEHHAEKNKMQKLLPIGMNRSIIAIGTMWLLNICQARYSFVVLPQPSVSIFSNHQQCLLSKRQTGPGISKHPVTECDNKVESWPFFVSPAPIFRKYLSDCNFLLSFPNVISFGLVTFSNPELFQWR